MREAGGGQFEDSVTLRKLLGFSETPFDIPEEILWNRKFPIELDTTPQIDFSDFCTTLKEEFANETNGATRTLAGKILAKISLHSDKVIGGSADLSVSN